MSTPKIPLASLLAALRAITAPLGAVPRVSSIDGIHWQCLAMDLETSEHADALPCGVDTSPEGAADMMLQALHASGLTEGSSERDGLLRTLATHFPAGITFSAQELDALAQELDAEATETDAAPSRARVA